MKPIELGGAAGLECCRGVDGAPGLVTGGLQGHVAGRAVAGNVGGVVGVA